LYNPAQHSTTGSGQGGPAWNVYVSISKSIVTNQLPALVKIDNIGPGLKGQVTPRYVRVYVTGPYVNISKLGSLTAHVNIAGYGVGTYNLTPSVKLPASLGGYSVTPQLVQVVIQPKSG
jgi:hypothetical protein